MWDQAASRVIREAFNLSDGEEKFIVNAKIGQGILVTPEGRLPFYNILTDEEKRLFTTHQNKVTAQFLASEGNRSSSNWRAPEFSATATAYHRR